MPATSQFQCPFCKTAFEQAANLAGRKALCPSCKTPFILCEIPQQSKNLGAQPAKNSIPDSEHESTAIEPCQCNLCGNYLPQSAMMLSSAGKSLCRKCGPGLFRERDKFENEQREMREKNEREIRERELAESAVAKNEAEMRELEKRKTPKPESDAFVQYVEKKADAVEQWILGSSLIGPQTQIKEKSKAPNQDAKANELRACPYCGESILRVAVICRYCQSPLEGSKHPGRMSTPLFTLICGGGILFVIGWIVLCLVLIKNTTFQLEGALVFAAIALIGTYFLPAMLAAHREHHNSEAILVVNLFLGWTFIGWVVSLALACTAVKRKE